MTVLFLRGGNPQIRSQRVLRPIPRVPQSDNYEGDDNPKDQENAVSPVPQHLEMFRCPREGGGRRKLNTGVTRHEVINDASTAAAAFSRGACKVQSVRTLIEPEYNFAC
jgi:hypothetical protein